MISSVHRLFNDLNDRRRKRFWLKNQLVNTRSSHGKCPHIEKLEDRNLLATMAWPLETTTIDNGLQALRGQDLQVLLADTGLVRGGLGTALGDLAHADTLAHDILATNASVSDFETRFATSVLPLDGDFEASLLNRISLSEVDLSQIVVNPQALFSRAIGGGAPQGVPILGPVSLSTNGAINEGEVLTLSGRYSESLNANTQNVRVYWGDGSSSLAVVDPVLRSFAATHRYGDNGQMSIRVEVTDTSGSVAIATAIQQVRNVAPTIRISPNASNSDRNQIRLDGNAFDAGFLDAVSVVWLAYPSGSPLNSRTGVGTSFTLDRSAFPNGIWQITATATDDDGGSSTFGTALLVGTAGSESIQIDDATFSSVGASRLIVMGLDGNDIIDGSQINSGNHQLILDGGLGVDYLFGGLGDDVYLLSQGDDYANVSVPGGPSVIFQEGNDTYRLTPNSTLTVVDLLGNNTLDFGLSDFGDGTGIKFDLGLVGSTELTVQDVSTSQPAQHFVRTLGNFTGVVGSRFGDSLTGTSGSTLWGGGGSDRFSVKEGTVGATFWGGADDDILTTSVTSVTGLLFNGDDGNDSLVNLGTISDLVFNGGADDDALVNTGTIVTTLSFGGDDGADTLWNTASITSLVFTGGADDDALVNTGTIVTTLSFGGDDGADTLWNTGSITSLVFTGGADDDALVNTGTIVTTLSFGGDDGSDLLNNSGSIWALSFVGGADDDALVSTGTIVTTLDFEGDDGSDALWNTGSIAAITFSGGADDDALVNTGTIVTTLVFGGDDGADMLRNSGSIGELTFAGGADDDALVSTGTIVTTLVFGGDDGADTLWNTGSVTAIGFTGGSDDDALVNTGTIVTTLGFGGDDGADTLWNRGSIGELTFVGGADDDVLVNTGTIVTTLGFGGDDGSDTLRNLGSIWELTFAGGADDDVLVNTGTIVTTLGFEGDDGSDTLWNTGSVGAIDFAGGADDDVLVNTGTIVTTLSFGGDDGADTLWNTGSVGRIVFAGGADDDVLVNTGTIVTTLSFGGDDGADTLVNSGLVASLFFDGGNGDDALQNSATVVSITFLGGADDDVLVNNGPGVTTIDFNGDNGADTLINNGNGIHAIIAMGGDGPDSVRIEGLEIGNVTFDGGFGADSFTFNAAGAGNSHVVFNAGAGSDFFAIRGSALSFVFDGGLGNDRLLISGSGSMNLNGGDGDDSFQFIANPSADVTLAETFIGLSDASKDTVDFSSFTGGAISLDLRLVNTWQSQGSGQLRVRLTDGMSLENVVGTPLADTIHGNARNNSISGAEFSEPFAGPVASARGVTQWVFLDFDSDTNTGAINTSTGLMDSGEHEYTVGERELIRQRVEANYRGPDINAPWFDVRVVTELSSIPTAYRTGNEFASVYFNRTPPNGRPGGLASDIDPGNIHLGGSAVVQISGLLGGVIQRSDGATDIEGDQEVFKSSVATISDLEIGASRPAATSENFVKLSAKLASHELAHLLGLRHQDSFGPIGSGVHNPPGAGSYNPVINGFAGGFETFDHILGSPASVGSTRFSDLNDLFFGEREAVKLSFASSDPAQTTFLNAGGNHTQSTAAALSPISIVVPNTLSRGQNFQKAFSVQITSAIGQIELDTTTHRSRSDWYSFSGRAGELINIDVLSNSVARFGTGSNGTLTPNDYLDTIVRVYNASGSLVQYYDGLAENDDTFEPTDSSLVDLLLPTDGTFYIEVDSFNRFGDSLGDPLNPQSPLNPANPNNILSNADILKRFQDSVNDTDTGRYQLIMYKFRKANASDLIDNIKGFGGVDTINGGPGDSFALSYDLGDSATAGEGSVFSRTVAIDDRAASSWTGSSVDFGDGTGIQPLVVSSDGEFTLNHVWRDNGSYTIQIVAVDDIGQTSKQQLQVSVANVAPTITLSLSGPSTISAGTSVTVSSITNDPAGTNDPLVLSWVVTRNGVLFATQPGDTNYVFSSTLAGIYVVSLAANDGDSGTAIAFSTIAVNAIPTVAVTMSDDGVRGVASHFTFTATDEDAVDQQGLFTFEIQWGDGSTQTVTGPSSTTVAHVYSAVSSSGVFAVSAAATDARGAASRVANKDMVVRGWTVMSDPSAPSHAILVIVGSQGPDDIKVKARDEDFYKITIRDRNDDVLIRGTAFGDIRKILVFAHGGNDRVTIDDDVLLTTEVWGGSGDDSIKGGSGNDILLGESGEDKIWGGDGRDFIAGGTGADRLHGDAYDDILVSGFTAFESEFNQSAPSTFSATTRLPLNQQRRALEAIMAEWTSTRSYSDRRSNVRGTGTGTRTNGSYFLRVSDTSMINNTVFDDSSVDKLWGDSGSDWFFANLSPDLGNVLDEVKDRSGNESSEDIDLWW
jgi:hypothetical protein